MKIKSVLIISVFLLILSSCSNNIDTQASNTLGKSFIILDADNGNKIISTLEYSNSGKRLASASFYDEDEELEKKINFEYDDAGSIVSRSVIEADGKTNATIYTSSRSSGNNGAISGVSRSLSDGNALTLEYTYDDSGLIKSITATSTKDGVTTVEEKLYE